MDNMIFNIKNRGSATPVVEVEVGIESESSCLTIKLDGIEILWLEPDKGHLTIVQLLEEEAKALESKGIELIDRFLVIEATDEHMNTMNVRLEK